MDTEKLIKLLKETKPALPCVKFGYYLHGKSLCVKFGGDIDSKEHLYSTNLYDLLVKVIYSEEKKNEQSNK